MVNLISLGRLLLAGHIFLTSAAFAQNEKLFSPADENILSSKATAKVIEIKGRNKSKTFGLYKFKFSVLDQKSFLMDVPDGRKVLMTRQFLTKNPTHLSYAATSEAEQVHLTLVTSGSSVVGALRTQFATYTVDLVGEDGLYLISNVDPSTVPQSDHGQRVPPPALLEQREREYQDEQKKKKNPTGQNGQSTQSMQQSVISAAVGSGATNIDLMVQYTASARTYGGGNDLSIAADIRAAVTQANQSFANSGINVQVNLVDLGYTAFNESGKNIVQALDGWTARPDVIPRRNQVAADVAMVIVSPTGGSCGSTNLNTSLQPQPGIAYSAINVACLKSSDATLAHELGHILVADHNIGASQAPYTTAGSAHGWPGTNDTNSSRLWNGTIWYACQHTMMAYPTTNPGCTTQRMLYWSDPLKQILWYYNGTTTQSYWTIGSSTANNVNQVKSAAPTVSAFRGPAGGVSGGGGSSGSEGTSTQTIFNLITQLLGGW